MTPAILNRFMVSLLISAMSLFASNAWFDDQAVAEMELPTDKVILFWSQEQRDYAFRNMHLVAPSRTIAAGEVRKSFNVGEQIDPEWELDGQSWNIQSYMEDQHAAGVIVIHDGKIRLEEYQRDFSDEQLWTSFSVAKSLTSSLVGAAIKDGYIDSMQDPLTKYIPQLAGSGYEGVTVEHLLTMKSGVRWNEDYGDPESDVAKFSLVKPEDGLDPVVVYMRTLESEAKPGRRWQYNTGETNLIGVLVANATGKTLSEYLSEKIWQPYGMTSDAQWMLNEGGNEIAGCCISARLRDYALFGMFALNGGVVGSASIVPDGWFDAAGSKQAGIGVRGRGYGYQWWTYDDGPYAAQGIFGQGIFIDPERNLVIASNGNWTEASSDEMKQRRNAFYRAVQQAVEKELPRQ
ncbi:MAG: serine hydrolase [Pseudomonadota bacterium]